MADQNQTGNTTGLVLCAIEVPDVFMVIIGSLAVLFNGLLLLLISNNQKIFFRTRVSYLVTNLALADFLTGAMLVLVMVLRMSPQRKQTLHGFEFLFLCTSIQISFLTLILMSLDRLVVTMLPLIWSRILTVRRTLVGIVFTWAVSIVSGIIIRYYTERKRLAMLLFLEISVFLFIASHVFIYQFLKRQRRRLVHSSSSALEMSAVVDLTMQASYAQITSVVFTLMLVLVLTYLPYIICLNILMVRQGTSIHVQLYNTVFRYTQAFSYLNYAVNPIVYAWRLRVYRRALYRMFSLVRMGELD